MNPESKLAKVVIAQAVHEVLHPLGFQKDGRHWRRTIDEVLQQFSLVSMRVGLKYRPEWGLNVLRRRKDPKPVYHAMHVRWTFELSVKSLPKRLKIFEAFDLAAALDESERRKRIISFLKYYVVPRFDGITTEATVRKMMGDWKYPMRAQSYGGLPKNWWPPD